MTTQLTQEPADVKISAILRDSFSSLIDFDIVMTGYTVTAYVVPASGDDAVAFTVVNTDLSAGQVTISLTAAQMVSIGLGMHKWYLQWVVSTTTRTAIAGDFEVTSYG